MKTPPIPGSGQPPLPNKTQPTLSTAPKPLSKAKLWLIIGGIALAVAIAVGSYRISLIAAHNAAYANQVQQARDITTVAAVGMSSAELESYLPAGEWVETTYETETIAYLFEADQLIGYRFNPEVITVGGYDWSLMSAAEFQYGYNGRIIEIVETDAGKTIYGRITDEQGMHSIAIILNDYDAIQLIELYPNDERYAQPSATEQRELIDVLTLPANNAVVDDISVLGEVLDQQYSAGKAYSSAVPSTLVTYAWGTVRLSEPESRVMFYELHHPEYLSVNGVPLTSGIDAILAANETATTTYEAGAGSGLMLSVPISDQLELKIWYDDILGEQPNQYALQYPGGGM